MRKVLLLAASALLVPGVALADGEEMAPMSPHFLSLGAGWTSMEMPEHQNGAVTFNFGGGFAPLTMQADVDGMSYAFAVGKDLSSGWRVAAGARFFDGDGSAFRTFAIPAATPFRRGTVGGLLQGSGAFGGAGAARQSLEVDVTDYAVGAAVGHGLGDIVRADLVVSYGARDSEYRNRVDETVNTEIYRTDTTFTENTVELAARLSAGFPLSEEFSFNVGGSAGWGLRNIDMNVFQLYQDGVTTTSRLSKDEDVDGFIGRADASLNFAIARSTSIGITANYVYDDMVPVYVAPVYPPAGTGSAATFSTESHTSMTYGLRLLGRF